MPFPIYHKTIELCMATRKTQTINYWRTSTVIFTHNPVVRYFPKNNKTKMSKRSLCLNCIYSYYKNYTNPTTILAEFSVTDPRISTGVRRLDVRPLFLLFVFSSFFCGILICGPSTNAHNQRRYER